MAYSLPFVCCFCICDTVCIMQMAVKAPSREVAQARRTLERLRRRASTVQVAANTGIHQSQVSRLLRGHFRRISANVRALLAYAAKPRPRKAPPPAPVRDAGWLGGGRGRSGGGGAGTGARSPGAGRRRRGGEDDRPPPPHGHGGGRGSGRRAPGQREGRLREYERRAEGAR